MVQLGTDAEPIAPEPTDVSEELTPEIVGRSPMQIFWTRFFRDRFAVAGLIVIGIICTLAICAPAHRSQHVVHHGPNDIYLFQMTTSEGVPKGPNKQFWFGADNAGQDLFVRVLYGARTSLVIALFATGMEMVIGVTAGIIAGFYRGKTDTAISRFSDIVLSLPVLLLALGIASACGVPPGCPGGPLLKPGLLLVSFIIALFSWPYLSRIVQGPGACRFARRSSWSRRGRWGPQTARIMRKEILPNIVAPIIVYTTLIIPANILFEAALSYLGVGVPRSTPSWGRELSDATTWFQTAWWMMVFPGLFLLATTLAFNLVGDGLRDALDPRAAAMSFRRQHQKRREHKAKAKAKGEVQPGQPVAIEEHG